jgi:hypothetical protein
LFVQEHKHRIVGNNLYHKIHQKDFGHYRKYQLALVEFVAQKHMVAVEIVEHKFVVVEQVVVVGELVHRSVVGVVEQVVAVVELVHKFVVEVVERVAVVGELVHMFAVGVVEQVVVVGELEHKLVVVEQVAVVGELVHMFVVEELVLDHKD